MKPTSVLDTIHQPSDIKKLTPQELPALCREIRRELVSTLSRTGGHLASNLGTVELTVALHRVFESPHDQIVWDVGHQSYTHKLLTGRRDRFSTLRQEGGLSGFPKHQESEHDAFLAGHSSTSISAAYGLVTAKRLQGDDGHVVAVIGDGAFTSGLAYEGMNNAGRSRDNLIIVLNDNEMSISKNVGALAKYLAVIRSKPEYFKVKDFTESTLKKIPVVGEKLRDSISASKSAFKQLLYHSNFFEDFGYVYLGPVNGHDVDSLCEVLERAKSLHMPVLVHIETTKGKGYSPAERNPGAFHGVSKFEIKTGEPLKKGGENFSSVFGRELTCLAREDKRICAITAAMQDGTGLDGFAQEFRPQGRFFDVGIAESHAVTFSCGLAANGMLPVFAVYSTFLQRSYDQVLHDASIEQKHIVLAVDRAGIVGDDGETHQGVFDVAMLSSIPGIIIYSPASFRQLTRCLRSALYEDAGVVAVRYPRGGEPAFPPGYPDQGGDYSYYGGGETLIVTYGRLSAEAAQAVELLKGQGKKVSLLALTKIFPLSEEVLALVSSHQEVLFVEEGIRSGSIGEHLASRLVERGYCGKFTLRAIENQFVPQASIPSALHSLGLDAQGIANTIIGESL